MVMAAVSLLAENATPTEDEVRSALEGNLCRCTGYHNIVRAVLAAAEAAGPVPGGSPPEGANTAAAGEGLAR
jgi:carbon-monoxide dehydrogenase small subunit